jgi:hypothetical protein
VARRLIYQSGKFDAGIGQPAGRTRWMGRLS